MFSSPYFLFWEILNLSLKFPVNVNLKLSIILFLLIAAARAPSLFLGQTLKPVGLSKIIYSTGPSPYLQV